MEDRKERLTLLFLKFLRALAKIQLAKIRPTVIGITGSAGKTSLRNAIAAVLKDAYRVKVSIKANSESGIPLNILGLTPTDYSLGEWIRIALRAPIKVLTNWKFYDIYVAELGIDRPHPPKNMEYLLTIVKPKIGVFLNALPVHSEYFDELVQDTQDPQKRREKVADLIAEEKGKLIRSLPKNGTAVLNTDDKRVRKFVQRTKARVITFATEGRAELTAKGVKIGLDGFSMQVREKNAVEKLTLNQILDKHYAQTLLGAIAVGRACGLPLTTCLRSLEKNFQLPPGRMTVIPGIKGTTILDSSYNASRKTTISALKLLAHVAPKRKVAILGDMRELGKVGKLEHEEVAKIAEKTADRIIAVGPMMRNWFVPRLKERGFPEKAVQSFISPYDAAKAARELIEKEDTILVKGSQNTIFLEIVVEALMKNPKDSKLLCRRGRFWDKKRQELKRELENS
ncbi:UDP-N-acetylmuramoyl-tripeptide--D-alanyl-D-alanine ligase [Patescibacteria group bacterium]|nr:UDP-N-acetylmuramoyl-tripeptide--D-alanyl-D-alanine ligase [Patescibacteria group bacterium]